MCLDTIGMLFKEYNQVCFLAENSYLMSCDSLYGVASVDNNSSLSNSPIFLHGFSMIKWALRCLRNIIFVFNTLINLFFVVSKKFK